MNSLKTLKLFTLIFLTVFLTSCIKSVEIGKIEKVKVNKISMTGINLEIQIPIKNPNFFDLKLKEVDINLTVNDIELGTIENVSKVVIPAKSDEIITFPIDLKLDNVLSGAIALIAGLSKKNANIKLDGTIKAKALFFTKTIKINKDQKVKLFK